MKSLCAYAVRSYSGLAGDQIVAKAVVSSRPPDQSLLAPVDGSVAAQIVEVHIPEVRTVRHAGVQALCVVAARAAMARIVGDRHARARAVRAATHATERTLTCLTGLTVGAGIAARTAMLGIPEDPNVGTILRRAHEHGLFTISLCHGPGSFLATALEGNEFLYSGYNMAIFPDSVDKKTPMIGYLPGHMPWRLGEKLTALGVKIVNTKSDKTCCLDRHLITGASPLAADALGKLAATTLLEHLI